MGDYPPGVTGREIELNGIPDEFIPECCGFCKHWAECKDRMEKEEICDMYEWNGEFLED